MYKPHRKCIGCNTIKNQDELIRITFDNDELIIDSDMKHPGRGAYLCNTKECLEKAIKRKALSRAFKKEISSEHIGRCFNDR